MAEGCQIECTWDRPVKPLAQASRHYLLVRLTGTGELAVAQQPAAPGNADATPAAASALHLAIALDASRSMEEHGRFAACTAACAALAGRLTTSDQLELAVFSKDLRLQLSPRPGGPEVVAEVQRMLGNVRPRGVTRTDLALKWCAERLTADSSALKLALLITDGDPTDDMGYPVPLEPLLEQARKLAAQGAQLCTAGVGSAEAYNAAALQTLAEAGGGQFIYCADAATLATRLLSRLPAGEAVWSGANALMLSPRQTGLEVRSACRLRPLPAQLEVQADGGGWQFDPGPLYGRQSVELLLELRLPAAAFGTSEGPNPILELALDGNTSHCSTEAALDYRGDPARAQQLNASVDQERRQWELRAQAAELQQLSAAELPARGAAEALLCRIEDAARYSGLRDVAAQAAQQVAQLRQTGLLTRSGAAELAEAARQAQQASVAPDWNPRGAPPPGGVP